MRTTPPALRARPPLSARLAAAERGSAGSSSCPTRTARRRSSWRSARPACVAAAPPAPTGPVTPDCVAPSAQLRVASAAEVQRAEQQAAVAQAKERAVRDRAARQRQAQWAESERRDAVRRSEAEAEAAAAVEAAAQEARAAEQAEAARANLADGSASGDGAESLLHDDDRSMYIAPAESPEPTAGDVMQVTDAALSTPARQEQLACAALTIQSVFRGRSERRVVTALVSQRESERLIQQASRIAAASAIQQAFSRFRARRTKYEVRDESSDFTPLPRSDATKPAKIPTPPVRFLPLFRNILSSVR